MPPDLLPTPGRGAERDPKDPRDFPYRDLIASGAVRKVTDAEWDQGYSAYDEVGLKPELRDQGNRLSCTCEAASQYGRVLRKKTAGDDIVFAASSLYPFIRLPGGGAYIRDAAKGLVNGRLVPKRILADEGEHGVPISEAEGSDARRITPAIAAEGIKLDVFDSYRMVDGLTDDVDVFASAIKTGLGALLGFTGTNNGWQCQVCRPPSVNESKWGHCIYGSDFGKTDVEACGLPVGTRAIFSPNSWGSAYSFKTGRWKGRQAIPAAYFQASVQTAVGTARGVYVFNAWTVMPNTIITEDQAVKDFLARNEGRIVQQLIDRPEAPASGAMAIVLDGRFLSISSERAGLAALTAIARGVKTGVVPVDKATWETMPIRTF